MNTQGIMPGGKSYVKGGPEDQDGPYKVDGRHDGPENDGCGALLPRPKHPKNSSSVEIINGVPFAERGKGL